MPDNLNQEVIVYSNPSNAKFKCYIPFNGEADYASKDFTLKIFTVQGDCCRGLLLSLSYGKLSLWMNK